MKLKNITRFGLMGLMVFPLVTAYGQTPATPVVSVSATPAVTVPVKTWPTLANLPPEVAEVAKLSHAGMGDDVVLAYVSNAQSTFNLTADNIVQLRDLGVSSPVISAMLGRDKTLREQNQNRPNAYVYSQTAVPPGDQPPATPPPAAQPPPVDYSATAAQVPPPGDVYQDQSQAPPPPATITVDPYWNSDYYYAPGYWGWNGVWIGGGWYPRGWGWGGGWGYHGGGGWHGGGGGGWHGGGGGHGGGHH